VPALQVNCLVSRKSTARAWLQKYLRNGQVGGRSGTGLWRVSSPTQDAALVAESQCKGT
jgi:hypothetical protein